jgi:DNA polymerase III epsilon subunit-like protein
MDDFVFGVVDTEGHHNTLHDICVVVVSLKDIVLNQAQNKSSVHFPTITMNNVGRYAGALSDTFDRCSYLVAHNKTTDKENIAFAFHKAGFKRDIPLPNKWVDSLGFVQGLKNTENSILKGLASHTMTSIYWKMFHERIENQHTAKNDAFALVRILEFLFITEPENFALLFPRSCAKTIMAIRNMHIPQNVNTHQNLRTEDENHHNLPAEDELLVEQKTLGHILEHNVVNRKIHGPLLFSCMATAKPVSGFYTWAFEESMLKKPLKGKKSFIQSFMIPNGKHIEIEGPKKNYNKYDKDTCFGVYSESEGLLRIL